MPYKDPEQKRKWKLLHRSGGLTLAAASVFKKDWSWWIIGALILVIGLFFQWNQKTKKE
jgi:hypothetical protein